MEFLSGPYFPVFGLDAEIYEVSLRILFKYRKIRTRKNSVFGHFSRSAYDQYTNIYQLQWKEKHEI